MLKHNNYSESTIGIIAAFFSFGLMSAGFVVSRVLDKFGLYQTMLYFKPPGARGQGLHQDHQYIREYPLIGVWLALDDSDKENGQMMVIPKSNKLGLLEVEETDMKKSFTTGQSVIPKNSNIIGIDMKCGDVLFFDGFLIHGSYLNTRVRNHPQIKSF